MTDPTPTDVGTAESALLRRILRAADRDVVLITGHTTRVVIDCELPVSPEEMALIERLIQ